MAFDLRLQRTCDHSVFDERQSITGLSPDFFGVLKFQSDGSTQFITIRELASTEGLSEFIPSRDGFTNFELSDDKTQINYNPLGIGGAGSASFLNAGTNVFPQPTLLVSYRTIPEQCPLCSEDFGIAQDTEFNFHGQLSQVSGRDKVKQLVFKALLTVLGRNEVVQAYGSTLSLLLGEKFTPIVEFRLHNAVEQAVRFLIEEQQNQPGLPLDETIASIVRITIEQDAEDPRRIRVQVDIRTANFETVPVNFTIVNA
jgi:hypothetical protein